MGYPKNFGELYIFELGVEFNRNGDGLIYIPPERHPNEFVWFGEDAHIQKIIAGDRSIVDVREMYFSESLPRVCRLMPDAPEFIQDKAASAVILIKLESHFNPDKVGKNANVALIDRRGKKTYSVTL